MFTNEKLLLQTPRFTVIFMLLCFVMHIAVLFGYINGIEMILDVFLIRRDPWQCYRLLTSLFILGSGTWTGLILALAGLHVGSWFVIAGNKSRWQKILLILSYNYTVLCLIAYFFSEDFGDPGLKDSFSFFKP